MKLRLNEDSCKGCSLCVDACPKGVLAIDTQKLNSRGYHPASVKHEDKCILCAACARMCPDTVIEIY